MTTMMGMAAEAHLHPPRRHRKSQFPTAPSIVVAWVKEGERHGKDGRKEGRVGAAAVGFIKGDPDKLGFVRLAKESLFARTCAGMDQKVGPRLREISAWPCLAVA